MPQHAICKFVMGFHQLMPWL